MSTSSDPVRVTRLPSGLTVVTERMDRVETVSFGAYVATGTRNELAEENGRPGRPEIHHGERGVMREGGGIMTGGLGLGEPELYAVHQSWWCAPGIFGVGDAVARRHEVELPGPDGLLVSEAVAVEHLPAEEPGDGVQTHVGMRAHRHGVARRDAGGTEAIEEAPCADRAPSALGKGPVHGQATDVGDTAVGDRDRQGRAFRRPSRIRCFPSFCASLANR